MDGDNVHSLQSTTAARRSLQIQQRVLRTLPAACAATALPLVALTGDLQVTAVPVKDEAVCLCDSAWDGLSEADAAHGTTGAVRQGARPTSCALDPIMASICFLEPLSVCYPGTLLCTQHTAFGLGRSLAWALRGLQVFIISAAHHATPAQLSFAIRSCLPKITSAARKLSG